LVSYFLSFTRFLKAIANYIQPINNVLQKRSIRQLWWPPVIKSLCVCVKQLFLQYSLLHLIWLCLLWDIVMHEMQLKICKQHDLCHMTISDLLLHDFDLGGLIWGQMYTMV